MLRKLYLEFYGDTYELKKILNQLNYISFIFTDERAFYKVKYHIDDDWVSVSACPPGEQGIWTTTSESNLVRINSTDEFQIAFVSSKMDTEMYRISIPIILNMKFIAYQIDR